MYMTISNLIGSSEVLTQLCIELVILWSGEQDCWRQAKVAEGFR